MGEIPILCPICGSKVELEPPPKDRWYDELMRKPIANHYYYVEIRKCLGDEKKARCLDILEEVRLVTSGVSL